MENGSDPRERYLIRYAGSFAPFVVGSADGSWMTMTDGRHMAVMTAPWITACQ